MNSIQEMDTTYGKVLCCLCGAYIDPNPLNMCFECTQHAVDITKGITRQGILCHCRGCDRYLDPPSNWLACEPQSQELLRLCVKRVHGLEKVQVVDVMFLYTEEHSKRIKLKFKVVGKLEEGTNTRNRLQHEVVVEFVVQNQICPACQKVDAKNFWKSMVQVRQKVDHKKTFLYLEQLVLKHKVNCTNLKLAPNGVDFLFDRRDTAMKFATFIQNVVPARKVFSKKLISQDFHNNTKDYKTTFSVEIAPICKDDIVCLPIQLARSLGQIGQICICLSLTNQIKLIDPLTAQVTEIDSQRYWKTPFSSIATAKNLKEYIVMDVELIDYKDRTQFKGQGGFSRKHAMADVMVIKSSEFGVVDTATHCRSHLGYILKPGDSVLGLDLSNCNVNNADLDKINPDRIPDVILVKKIYPDRNARRNRRKFKLKRIADIADNETDDEDLLEFMEDLEEDEQYRQNVNLYKDPAKISADSQALADTLGDFPSVQLSELMDDLTLGD